MTNDRIKLKEHNGIEIFVNSHGQFFAEVSGVGLHDSTIDRLKMRIEEEMKSEAKSIKLELPCHAFVHPDEDTYGVQELTLVGLSRNDSTLKWKESVDSKAVIFALPATPNNYSLLCELAKAEETVARITKYIDGRKLVYSRYGGRIQPSEYGKYIVGLQHKYSEALQASK